MDDIETKCRKITVDHLGVEAEKVTREAKFEDLGADSLDVLELTMAFEEEFGVEITDDELYKDENATFGGAVDLVTSKIG